MVNESVIFTFAIIGALYVVKITFSWLTNFCIHFLRCNLNLQRIYGNKTSNTWVAITGATGGLGFDYACEFAKRGFNILFIIRNLDKANEKISKLKQLYPNIETSILQCDLATLITDNAQFDRVKTTLETLLSTKDIGILVNNAGFEFDCKQFSDASLDDNLRLTKINIFPIIVFSQLLIPHMKQRNKNNNCRSMIINIGSGFAKMLMPTATLYGASKAWMDYFSICASKEYEKDKIDIIVSHPGTMTSAMTRFKDEWYNNILGIISTEKYARHSMKHFGRVLDIGIIN